MSRTTDGTAVAMIVESIATRAVDSITAARTGPRSDRSPTLLSDTCTTVTRDLRKRRAEAVGVHVPPADRPVGDLRAGRRPSPATAAPGPRCWSANAR